ncbi:MAG: hypothetical protein QM779_11800 [Propionicimonas sp.]|uniref:hypothetical protein n=1 Tax=Propionicimonas sp. TaxID=1955623 RepID=UPI003D0C7849
MNRLLAVVIAACLTLVGPPAATAGADGPGCDDQSDECTIVIVDPGNPSDPKPGDPDPAPRKHVVPKCADLGAGVIGPTGSSLADLGLDDAAHQGWVHVTCVDGNDLMWMWLDPGVAAESIARMLLARLQLKPITIGWTPLRADAMGIVGVPTWLWVDNPGRVTWGPATISAGGVTLTARVESVSWDMGNGDVVGCSNKGTRWAKGLGTGASPTCGYTYEKQGEYTVTATAHWVARWSGYGRSGVIPLALSQERMLEVGEIQVIVTNR